MAGIEPRDGAEEPQVSLADEPSPAIYVSHRQVSRLGMTFVIRTAAAGGENRLAQVRRHVVEQLRRAAGGSDGTAPNRE